MLDVTGVNCGCGKADHDKQAEPGPDGRETCGTSLERTLYRDGAQRTKSGHYRSG